MTHHDDDEIGTILDVTPRGLRVMWWSGEETEEVSADLILSEQISGTVAEMEYYYQEGPGGL